MFEGWKGRNYFLLKFCQQNRHKLFEILWNAWLYHPLLHTSNNWFLCSFTISCSVNTFCLNELHRPGKLSVLAGLRQFSELIPSIYEFKYLLSHYVSWQTSSCNGPGQLVHLSCVLKKTRRRGTGRVSGFSSPRRRYHCSSMDDGNVFVPTFCSGTVKCERV